MTTLLTRLFGAIQTTLFPAIEETIGSLTPREERFVRICEICNPDIHIVNQTALRGRPPAQRDAIARAFIAKSLYNFATTKILLEHLLADKNLRFLCGWSAKSDIPSESTFSRAFEEFSNSRIPEKIHETMIKTHYGEKLAGHISRDSTAIEAREKAAKKAAKPQKPLKKRGRPAKGTVPTPKEPSKLEIQLNRSFEENAADIVTLCDHGTKRDSKGNSYSWNGYKLHIDTIDGDIPVSALLSSASVHDSQLAIPLAQLSNQRVTNCYDLMDAAYDSQYIRAMSEKLNHVPIIDSNKRRGEKVEFTPAEKIRYNQRSSAERVNSNLKDNHGGATVRVKGAKKVMTHLMFGIIVIAAEALFRLVPQ
jgi:hypothetical protein